MSTVAQVVERVYERLHSPDEQPIKVPLSFAVLAADTSWTLDISTLTPEEQELLAVGIIVEVGQDQRLIEDASTTGVIQVSGAVNGTTAADHTVGSYVTLNPSFSRKRVFESVCDEVASLYPALWYETAIALTSSAAYAEVPATVAVALGFRYTHASGRTMSGHVNLIKNFPDSSTGQAVEFYSTPSNVAGYLQYRSKFAHPTAESDDLADFGVDPSWERILVVGALADVIYSIDIDKLSVEWLARQLEGEQVPVGSATRIRDSLLRQREYYIDQAAKRLKAETPTPTVFSNLFAAGY